MNVRTLLVFVALFAACGEEATEADVGIQWFDGTVDEAFAHAKATGKPVYLYWGAVWCPPCHAIQATVFRSPEFIERSRLFVPVYLDGDKENAQAAGERFGVFGYPTMIVFDADGRELTRIPGGIDLQAYANILDVTLGHASSATDIVQRVMTGGATLSPAECQQLAWYSWEQDVTILEPYDPVTAFRRMRSACPEDADVERSLLFFNALDARLNALENDIDADALSVDEIGQAVAMLDQVLGDYRLTRANVVAMNFSGARYVAALTESGSERRRQLIRRFNDAYDALFADETLYKRERLYTLAGRIDFERIDDEEAALSDKLKQRIRDTARWADESTPSVYERQPIINAMANVLESAGMDDEGRELLLAELEISEQPYYYMVGLADIEQRAGNHDRAIDWLKKAWDSSLGPATRFQWGYYYLTGLIEMRPEDADAIRNTTVALITELQSGGGFYQRPKAQLARLESALEEWGGTHDARATLESIRAEVVTVCARDPEPVSRATCESFLDAA
ncbi:MAG: thioredoxin family protein [Woeseiaceae bacterium]|nr:thioredoxin family protein [Woeseiaceae bacterium]